MTRKREGFVDSRGNTTDTYEKLGNGEGRCDLETKLYSREVSHSEKQDTKSLSEFERHNGTNQITIISESRAKRSRDKSKKVQPTLRRREEARLL